MRAQPKLKRETFATSRQLEFCSPEGVHQPDRSRRRAMAAHLHSEFPLFKMGQMICGRKSALLAYVQSQEAQAADTLPPPAPARTPHRPQHKHRGRTRKRDDEAAAATT